MSVLQWAIEQTIRPTLTRWTKLGWIGVDIGTHAIKLAQLERHASQYRIAARWTLADPGHSLATGADSCSDAMRNQIAKIKTLKQLFSGRNCAAVLPMALVDLRSFEIPKGSPSEQFRMTGEELSADLGVEPQELAFDCWETAMEGVQETGLTRMSVNAVPMKLATLLGDRLLAAGLACQVLDGMPSALARAVEMAGTKQVDDAVVAIDLGYTLPLVVLVKNGRPVFARTLRGVGMHSIMQPLAASLDISSEECQQLLFRFGVTAIGQTPTLATQRTMQIIANPLQVLLSEIKRTVEYIGQQFRACKPRQVCLFGGGALVKNLPEHISHRLQIPVAPWSLGGHHPDPSDAIYGVAAGLSSLAWEETTCS